VDRVWAYFFLPIVIAKMNTVANAQAQAATELYMSTWNSMWFSFLLAVTRVVEVCSRGGECVVLPLVSGVALTQVGLRLCLSPQLTVRG